MAQEGPFSLRGIQVTGYNDLCGIIITRQGVRSSSIINPYSFPGFILGMGKSKLLSYIQGKLNQIRQETVRADGSPSFSFFTGSAADISHRHQNLHPWRHVIMHLLKADM